MSVWWSLSSLVGTMWVVVDGSAQDGGRGGGQSKVLLQCTYCTRTHHQLYVYAAHMHTRAHTQTRIHTHTHMHTHMHMRTHTHTDETVRNQSAREVIEPTTQNPYPCTRPLCKVWAGADRGVSEPTKWPPSKDCSVIISLPCLDCSHTHVQLTTMEGFTPTHIHCSTDYQHASTHMHTHTHTVTCMHACTHTHCTHNTMYTD